MTHAGDDVFAAGRLQKTPCTSSSICGKVTQGKSGVGMFVQWGTAAEKPPHR